jgi:PAS domain S-box-containing protein
MTTKPIKKEFEQRVKIFDEDAAERKVTGSSINDNLRRRAEEFLKKKPSTIKKMPYREVQKIIEDLQIHQIELEMQNKELRNTQLELEVARDKYSDLYDFAPIGYFTISDKGILAEANLVCATMLGVERRSLTNKPFSQFIAMDDQDIFYFHRRKLFESKIKQVCELRLSRNDGTEFYAQLESKAVKDGQGDYRYIRSSLSDITERKLAEMELITTKKEMEAILRTVPDIIYRLDSAGLITFISDSVAKYGYPPEELLGTNVMEIVYPKDKEKTLHRIKEKRTGERSTKSFETRLLTKNQTPVSFEVFLISAEGLYSPQKTGKDIFLGTQGIAKDITERKEVEEEREKLILKLQVALDNIKILKGLLPICANCKKIRDDKGYWNQIEIYIREHSDAEFSHGICPGCAQNLYPDLNL